MEGGLGQFVDLRGTWKERESGAFVGGGGVGVDTPMHTMPYVYVYFLNIFLLLFINKYVFFSFSFLFCDEIPNIHSRILTNQKPE